MRVVDQLRKEGRLDPIDVQFARLLRELDPNLPPEIELAAALVSRASAEGHICLDLANLTPDVAELISVSKPEVLTSSATVSGPDSEITTPATPSGPARVAESDSSTCLHPAALRHSPLVGEPGQSALTPLILDTAGRLYLHRFFRYEQNLAASILQRANRTPEVDDRRLQESLDRYFPKPANGQLDLQRHAAENAVRRHFAVISGGPGTGKTTTVIRLLAVLLEQDPHLRIACAAPTGKAAARLQESIASQLLGLPESSNKALIPTEARTLHALLRFHPDRSLPIHRADNPLPADVVIVDEASMIDLALMAKLFDAVPEFARIVLLGDKDQLASVEPGAVLGHICQAAAEASDSGLSHAVTLLKKSHRFDAGSGIGNVAQAINDGDANRTVQTLKSIHFSDLAFGDGDLELLCEQRLRLQLEAESVEEAFARFRECRVLCALRRGPRGVEEINARIERTLGVGDRDEWYAGRPVMVVENDYDNHLFNGDVGLAWGEGEELQVMFEAPDNRLRAFHPSRLPAYETVYAMTVHKSQGSEFDHVVVMLPDQPSPILTRELLYTAITRARQSAEIWGSESVLRQAVGTSVQRHAGLIDALNSSAVL